MVLHILIRIYKYIENATFHWICDKINIADDFLLLLQICVLANSPPPCWFLTGHSCLLMMICGRWWQSIVICSHCLYTMLKLTYNIQQTYMENTPMLEMYVLLVIKILITLIFYHFRNWHSKVAMRFSIFNYFYYYVIVFNMHSFLTMSHPKMTIHM